MDEQWKWKLCNCSNETEDKFNTQQKQGFWKKTSGQIFFRLHHQYFNFSTIILDAWGLLVHHLRNKADTNLRATKHQSKSAHFNLYVLLFPEGLLEFSKTFHVNVDSKSAQLSQEVLNLKTVSSLLLKAKTLRAFKEMVTNDYHLLVQLPYPTHYHFKTTLFAQKQCYSQWSCSQTCYI